MPIPIQHSGVAMLSDSADILRFRISAANDDWMASVPELPRPTQRWTVRRKATIVQAVRGGWVPIEEVCDLYNISVDEFLAWESYVDRYGVHGLRTTRYQIYRDTDKEGRR
jgi:Protein of unknown function (DUF1153)